MKLRLIRTNRNMILKLAVLTMNHFLDIVSASTKKTAPTRASLRKSDASMAIHLKMANPALDFKTKSAMAC
jgi:hypothetical protein